MFDRLFDTGKVKLDYTEGPDAGPPLIIIPGGPSRWQKGYVKLFSALSTRWHVYAYNHRGTGKSTHTRQYRLKDLIDDAVAFTEHMGEPPVLFGHSLGGMVGIGVASKPGEKVSALVLADPPMTNRGTRGWLTSELFVNYVKAYMSLRESSESVTEIAYRLGEGTLTPQNLETARTISQHDTGFYRSWLAYDDWIQDVDLDSMLKEIKCPVLLLQADTVGMGQAVTDEDVEYAESVLPGLTHAKLAGLDHGMGFDTWKASPALMEELMKYLEYIRP
ncbi:alpha/beta hydrolase [Candidatus Bathyarchaeota archaeon]|nr:alpha/beta hydrolase [Candidatus Bathyarchaeota archaeon]